MKTIVRTARPDCWMDVKIIGWYANLRDDKGKISARWTTTCLDDDGISAIRKALWTMSEKCCAYCGKQLKLSEMDVEHYLPKEAFEYLAYCWENYLPSCKRCNQNLKGTYVPSTLQEKILKDPVILHLKAEERYDKTSVLMACLDRIIDPSFDNPSEHLTFDVLLHGYIPKTAIGICTNNYFFNDKEVADDLEKISESVRELIVGGHSNPLQYIQT